MTDRPLLLLQTANVAPYLSAIAERGLADRIEARPVNPGEAPAEDLLSRAEILFSMGPPAGLLARMPRLKWIQSLTAGVDHWLARDDLSPRHMLTAARGTHRIQMPENILGALFHITKPFTAIAADQKDARWTRRASETLAGKTLAILGLGAIGQELARKAAALEMTVIGTKRSPAPVAGVAEVLAPERTDEALARAHFVVLLLPVTDATRDIMNRQRIARMRSDAWLLNFGRGQLVVDDDLIAAVTSKTIAGAVLDVFRAEPLPPAHGFWRTPGIVVLPHIGGVHRERDRWVAALLADNVGRFLAGEPLREVVDRGRGY